MVCALVIPSAVPGVSPSGLRCIVACLIATTNTLVCREFVLQVGEEQLPLPPAAGI